MRKKRNLKRCSKRIKRGNMYFKLLVREIVNHTSSDIFDVLTPSSRKEVAKAILGLLVDRKCIKFKLSSSAR